MAITGGTWEKKWDNAIISNGEHPDDCINRLAHRELYGGALIAESIYNPDDLALFLAAPRMLETLENASRILELAHVLAVAGGHASSEKAFGFAVSEVEKVIKLAKGKG